MASDVKLFASHNYSISCFLVEKVCLPRNFFLACLITLVLFLEMLKVICGCDFLLSFFHRFGLLLLTVVNIIVDCYIW